jgi:CDP-glucose 4,6-dehydratase
MNPNKNFWEHKKVLITGHTGFKGAWLTLWLNKLGADVTGIGLKPITIPSLFESAKIDKYCNSIFCDIRDEKKITKVIHESKPEIIFHLAAQPLVRKSYTNPLETFSTNVMGTANLLDSLRGLNSLRAAVIITTDKVYHNNEWVWPYREDDKLGGHDPYSSSKAASELVIDSFYKSFLKGQGIGLASARAGNVIGGGDWSDDRLIPDTVKSWESGRILEIRNPFAKRPWQHVLEPLLGYIRLAESLALNPILSGSYNFGPLSHEAASVKKVIEIAKSKYLNANTSYSEISNGPHEAGWLALDISKAKHILKFEPRLDLTNAVEMTINWYQNFYEGKNAYDLCIQDINKYEILYE